jgi:hypothetical protein
MPSKDEDKWIYRHLTSKYYDNDLGVYALDYYKPESRGEDDFSRKQVWFYVYGDQEIFEEFSEGLRELMDDTIASGDNSWDLITILPTHVEGQVNSNMEKLAESVSGEYGIPVRNLIERKTTINQNDVLGSFRERLINVEESLEVTEDVEGKNIILMDNISVSGASMLHAGNLLLENGASRVVGLVLGVSEDHDGNDLRGISGSSYEELENRVENPRRIETLEQ